VVGETTAGCDAVRPRPAVTNTELTRYFERRSHAPPQVQLAVTNKLALLVRSSVRVYTLYADHTEQCSEPADWGSVLVSAVASTAVRWCARWGAARVRLAASTSATVGTEQRSLCWIDLGC
jgi:hypothetical protein